MATTQLLLEDYIAALRVGILPQERKAPQRVRVNVVATLRKQPTSDNISKTYDYTNIIDEIDALADKHFDLLEILAEKLAKKILKDKKLEAVEIELVKLDALETGRVGVRYSLHK